MARRHFAIVQLCVWTLYGLIHYAAAVPAVPDAVRWHMAGWKLVRAATGCLTSSLLPLLYRRLPGGMERVPVVVVKVAAVSYGLGMLWSAFDRAVLVTVAASTPLEVYWSLFPRGFELDYVVMMLAWSGGYLAARYGALAGARQRDALAQEVAARDARLQALATQLHPHFLFNTLNSIRSLVDEDGVGAREMITRLATFLRHTLGARQLDTLGRELEAVRAYLAIETVRFADRLEATITSSADAEACLVPPLILQPLVENAIAHGSAPAAMPLRLSVRAEMVGTTLRVMVTNPGSLGDGHAAPREPPRLGLANVRARLAYAFGDRQRFALEERDGSVLATIEVEEAADAGAARADRG